MRELHWHPNTDEWQYYIAGQAAWASSRPPVRRGRSTSRLGMLVCPFAMGHYVENTGTTTLRFLEMFKSSYYADVSLDQWMALTRQNCCGCTCIWINR